MAERNRIFVGGLFPGVTEEELVERFSKFGKVDRVEIKIRRDDTGVPIKTFAYVEGHFVKSDLKKCFSIYNNTKWKGNVLKLQHAKESFLDKLKHEIESEDVDKAHSSDSAVPMTCRREVKKAVPGTSLEGEKNWVIGKYGAALPIVYIRRKDKRKIIKIDPSKYCHNVKRMKSEERNDPSDVNHLTWGLKENDSEAVKRRKGIFPEFKPKKQTKKGVTNFSDKAQVVNQNRALVDFSSEAQVVNKEKTNSQPFLSHDAVSTNQDNDDFEVVKIQPMPEPMSLKEKMLRIAGMFEETPEEKHHDSDSDATGDIIASYNPRSCGDIPVEMQTSNSLCMLKSNSKPQPLGCKNRKCTSLKPIQDKGHELLKCRSYMYKQNKLATISKDTSNLTGNEKSCSSLKKYSSDKVLFSSSSDSADENGNILSNISSERQEIVPAFSIKEPFSYAISHPARSNNYALFSGGMDEFATGLISRGEDLVLPDQADTSSTESDCNSEDYEGLATRTPTSSRQIKCGDNLMVVDTKKLPLTSTPKHGHGTQEAKLLSGVKMLLSPRNKVHEGSKSLNTLSSVSSENASQTEQYSVSEEVYHSCSNIDECVNSSCLERQDEVYAGQNQKSFPFKGTMSLQGRLDQNISEEQTLESEMDQTLSSDDIAVVVTKAEIHTTALEKYSTTKGFHNSSSDSGDENGNILPNKKSTESQKIGRFTSAATHDARSNNHAVFSGGMGGFAAGWIYRGEDLVLPDPATSSDSDYNSEDYENLIARIPTSSRQIKAGVNPVVAGTKTSPFASTSKHGHETQETKSFLGVKTQLSSRNKVHETLSCVSSEILIARTPKPIKSSVGNKQDTGMEVQTETLLRKEKCVDQPTSEACNKAAQDQQRFCEREYQNIVECVNQPLKSAGAFPSNSTSLPEKRSKRENISNAIHLEHNGIHLESGSSCEMDSVENIDVRGDAFSKKQGLVTDEQSSLGAVLKSRKRPFVESGISQLNKHNTDNQKRLSSLRQRRREALSQKSLLQKSLKHVDNGLGSNKKIVFSSEDEVESQDPKTVEKGEVKTTAKLDVGKEKATLFHSSSDESDDLSDTEMFGSKAQFEGEAGKRLMNLQSRFGNDPRFKLDHRFIESDEKKDQNNVEASEEESETKKMMQILQDVVGHQVPVGTDSSKKLFRRPVRYDPTKEDHSKFEKKSTAKGKTKIVDIDLPSCSENTEDSGEDQGTVLPEVDKRRFFEVSSSLKEAFGEKDKNSAAGGFSLLATFGKVDSESSTVKPVQEKPKKIEAKNVEQQMKHFFGSDDSPGEKLNSKDQLSDRAQSSATNVQTCFFTSDDPRLKEGVLAFSTGRSWSAIQEEWRENRPYWVESYRTIHKRVSRRVKATRGRRNKRLNKTF